MADDVLSINQKIVAFANSNEGKFVENGDCWRFPEKALTSAGAKNSNDVMGRERVKKRDKSVDYEWGTPIQAKDAVPGDIIQFRDYFFIETTKTNYDCSTGEKISISKSVKFNRGQHSAIVADMIDENGAITVWEQWPGHEIQQDTLYVRNPDPDISTNGKIAVADIEVPKGEDYNEPRKLKKAALAKNANATATFQKIVTIEVFGKFWIYRPMPK